MSNTGTRYKRLRLLSKIDVSVLNMTGIPRKKKKKKKPLITFFSYSKRIIVLKMLHSFAV